MAETLSTLETQLEALREARASGVQTVSFEGGDGTKKLTTFRSDRELANAIADIERRIAGLMGSRVKVTYITNTKGL